MGGMPGGDMGAMPGGDMGGGADASGGDMGAMPGGDMGGRASASTRTGASPTGINAILVEKYVWNGLMVLRINLVQPRPAPAPVWRRHGRHARW